MSIAAPAASVAAAPRRAVHRTGSLIVEVPPVAPAAPNRDVFGIFEANPGLDGLPVVDGGRPIGLINRNIFMQSMARPFHREVYLGKSCIAFMDKSPLIVDKDASIQDLSFMALDVGGKILADGFIVTADGLYAGMGRAQDMVKAVADLQAEKNRQVLESIDYASVIQKSLGRASREALRQALPDHFLLWEPRDIVAGDYFHFQAFPGGFFAALFDCTGHGVPGAFMTMIMSSFLQNALSADTWRDPAAVLGLVSRRVKTALGQIDHTHSEVSVDHGSDDGMDAAFCAFDTASRTLTFSGAHMPMYLLEPGADIRIVEGDRAGVGYGTTPMAQEWTNHRIEAAPGAACCFFTDGLVDQLGGPKRIAFGKRRLAALLAEQRGRPMPEQRAAVMDALLAWQGEEARKDDVAGLGFTL